MTKLKSRSEEQIVADVQQRGKLTRQDVYEVLKLKKEEKETEGEKTERVETFLGKLGRIMTDEAKERVLKDIKSYPGG